MTKSEYNKTMFLQALENKCDKIDDLENEIDDLEKEIERLESEIEELEGE